MRAFDKKYLNLLREIIISEFKLKDQSSFFGFVWSFLHPLLMLIVLFIFFNARIGGEIKHYPIYLLIGLIQYTHFSNATSSAMSVLASMRQLTANTIFPKEILVIGSVVSSSIEFLISMTICLLIAYFSGVRLTWTVVTLPLILLLQLMLVMWVSLLLSCVYVFAKDIGHIYQVFLRILFFVTPVFYSVSFLEGAYAKYILYLNPLAQLMNFARAVILDGTLFSTELFGILLGLNALLVYLGFKWFKKYEPRFGERV
jgi:ABC-type polysaccharide/polyol phosphate export permease